MQYLSVNDRFAVDAFAQPFYVGGRDVYFYRLIAMRDFCGIKQGDYGGFVQEPDALTADGTCWADSNSFIFAGSQISGEVYLQNSVLSGQCRLSGGVWMISTQACSVEAAGLAAAQGCELHDCSLTGKARAVNSQLYAVSLQDFANAEDCILVNTALRGNTLLKYCTIHGDEGQILILDGVHLHDQEIFGSKELQMVLQPGQSAHKAGTEASKAWAFI